MAVAAVKVDSRNVSDQCGGVWETSSYPFWDSLRFLAHDVYPKENNLVYDSLDPG